MNSAQTHTRTSSKVWGEKWKRERGKGREGRRKKERGREGGKESHDFCTSELQCVIFVILLQYIPYHTT